MDGKGTPPIESTAERIRYARKEQLAARAAGDAKLENTWTEALDRLLSIYLEERLHANC